MSPLCVVNTTKSKPVSLKSSVWTHIGLIYVLNESQFTWSWNFAWVL